MLTDLRATKLNPDGSHYFEHNDREDILPWREWIRANLPTGADGFTFEDVDGLAAVHGALAPDGAKFLLLEIKWMRTRLDPSQQINFQRLHRLLRKGDPQAREYVGFYILEWSREERAPHVRLNQRTMLDPAQLRDFLLCRHYYPSYFDPA